ncbi:MAG TPA: hypothetical protein VJX71_28785 [Methylomirabilota bacterium]|nr:hypothetical protein [Methylomirabilota bacterium]
MNDRNTSWVGFTFVTVFTLMFGTPSNAGKQEGPAAVSRVFDLARQVASLTDRLADTGSIDENQLSLAWRALDEAEGRLPLEITNRAGEGSGPARGYIACHTLLANAGNYAKLRQPERAHASTRAAIDCYSRELGYTGNAARSDQPYELTPPRGAAAVRPRQPSVAQEWHRSDGPYRKITCPSGQVLVPILGGVKCQKPPQCGPDQIAIGGANGLECRQRERPVEMVQLDRDLYAFFPVRAGKDLDLICVAWPQGLHRQREQREGLFAEHHVGQQGFVESWSYELDVKAKKIIVTEVRQFGWVNSEGVKTGGEPIKLNIPLPLYDKPQKDWPCTKEMWDAQLFFVMGQPHRPYGWRPLPPWDPASPNWDPLQCAPMQERNAIGTKCSNRF